MNRIIRPTDQRIVLPGTEPQRILDVAVDREGLPPGKVWGLIQMRREKYLRAIAKLKKLTDIEPGKLSEMTRNLIRVIITDVDEAITKHHQPIPGESVDWINDHLDAGYKVILHSNSKSTPRIADLCEQTKGRIYVVETTTPKPGTKGFRAVLTRFNAQPTEAIMIGDNPSTDGGSNRIGIPFVQVEPIPPHEDELSLRRKLQIASRRAAIEKSEEFDHLYGRRVIRDGYVWG